MEKLEYLIRTLTYKRSCLELSRRTTNMTETLLIDGTIKGLSIAITEIYKLVGEQDNGTKD